MADKNIGKITQIIGAVLDIKFTNGSLPEINTAINVYRKNGEKLVVEVAQHLGDDTVRCIAMGTTDGLVRGMEALTFLINNCVYCYSSFTCLPVTYDKFSLTSSDRYHCINSLDTGL